MPFGTVSHFDWRAGYGFIFPDDGADDVFVGRKECKQHDECYLEKGDNVEFFVPTFYEKKKEWHKDMVVWCSGWKEWQDNQRDSWQSHADRQPTPPDGPPPKRLRRKEEVMKKVLDLVETLVE